MYRKESKRPIFPLRLSMATAVLALWTFFTVAEDSQAQQNRRHRSISKQTQPLVVHQRQARTTRSVKRQSTLPRSVIPPTGMSAANVPPGYYQKLSSPHPHRSGVVVPQVVYVQQPFFYPTVPVVEASPVYASNPAPIPVQPQIQHQQPQPVYVVNQPPPTPVAPVQVAPPVREAPRPLPPKPTTPKVSAAVDFAIFPTDAKVYLDEEFLGTGDELANLNSLMILPPGVYVLEVTHPEHRSQRLVFGIGTSETKEVSVNLAAERTRRRSRVK